MRIRLVDNPKTKAEGLCNGLPYDTQLVNINGVNIHFWVSDPYDSMQLPAALSKAINERDIVSATWSLGEPTGFWAHQNID